MRHRIMLAALVLACSLAPQAEAACEYPGDVKLPDGATATEAMLTEARKRGYE